MWDVIASALFSHYICSENSTRNIIELLKLTIDFPLDIVIQGLVKLQSDKKVRVVCYTYCVLRSLRNHPGFAY